MRTSPRWMRRAKASRAVAALGIAWQLACRHRPVPPLAYPQSGFGDSPKRVAGSSKNRCTWLGKRPDRRGPHLGLPRPLSQELPKIAQAGFGAQALACGSSPRTQVEVCTPNETPPLRLTKGSFLPGAVELTKIFFAHLFSSLASCLSPLRLGPRPALVFPGSCLPVRSKQDGTCRAR
jgi:hypothetical protein